MGNKLKSPQSSNPAATLSHCPALPEEPSAAGPWCARSPSPSPPLEGWWTLQAERSCQVGMGNHPAGSPPLSPKQRDSSWNKKEFHPRKKYWRKSQGRLAETFTFRRLAFPPTSAPTPGPRLGLGQPCSGAEGTRLLLLTARGCCCSEVMPWHQPSSRRFPPCCAGYTAHTQDLEYIHCSKTYRNTASKVGKCTQSTSCALSSRLTPEPLPWVSSSFPQGWLLTLLSFPLLLPPQVPKPLRSPPEFPWHCTRLSVSSLAAPALLVAAPRTAPGEPHCTSPAIRV